MLDGRVYGKRKYNIAPTNPGNSSEKIVLGRFGFNFLDALVIASRVHGEVKGLSSEALTMSLVVSSEGWNNDQSLFIYLFI